MESLLSFDIYLFKLIHGASSCSGSWFDNFNLFVSKHSQHIFYIFLLIIALIRGKKHWFSSLITATGFIIIWHLTDEYIKPFFQRDRPFVELGTCVFGLKPSSASFPSGHTITAFTMATLICLYNPKQKIICAVAILLACLVAYSRIYLGVHFPSDILGGIIFGILFGIAWFEAIEISLKLYYED